MTIAAQLPLTEPAVTAIGYKVAGLDISLTGTGISTLGGTVRIPTKGKRADSLASRHRRLAGIARAALEAVGHVDLAVIEGPSHNSIGGSAWDRGGLWWLIVDGLLDREIPVAVAPPRCRAKYATGNGNARKDSVMACARQRYGRLLATDDEADAEVLRRMGLDWLGCSEVPVPETHRSALLGCEWPDLGAAA